MEKADAELKVVLAMVLEGQRREIMRALRARGYNLARGQVIEVVPGEGLAVLVRIITAPRVGGVVTALPAREFFTLDAFERIIGKHPLTRTLVDRLHRLINGHGWTVGEFLELPTTTVAELVSRDWQPAHIALLRQFLDAHALALRET